MSAIRCGPTMVLVRDFAAPMLLASWPFVAFLGANHAQLFRIGDVVFVWAAWLVAVVVATLAATLAIPGHPLARIGVVAGALSVAFFSFGSLADLLVLAGIELGSVWLAIWGVIFVATGWLVWHAARHTMAGFVATVVALALLAWPVVELASAALGPRAADEVVANAGTPTQGAPNVYWFLLDGYVRDDNLQRYFGHDNEPFLAFLKARRFHTARASLSNYDNTTFSLTTTLSTNYRHVPGAKRPANASLVRTLSGFNPVVRKFLSLGYRYIHAPYAGSAKTQCGGLEHRCLRARPSGRIALNEVQIGMLQLTPLFRVLRRGFAGAFHYDHIFVEDVTVAMRAPPPQEPFFLFAHILSPHAPPRFTPDCARLDGIATSIDVGEGTYDPAQFRTDVACTNRSVMAAVDDIIKRDRSDPIIILQGDHGFKFRLPGEPAAPGDDVTIANRRLAILNAMRLPERCGELFYQSISPVNTFRLVFACIEDRHPEFVAERHFVRQHGSGQLREVRP